MRWGKGEEKTKDERQHNELCQSGQVGQMNLYLCPWACAQDLCSPSNVDSYLVDRKDKKADEFGRAPGEGTIAPQSVKPTVFSV